MVSQLALAHERQLIQKGCALHLSVDHAAEELTKNSRSHTASEKEKFVPLIKLQMLHKGKKQDINLDDITASFAS